MGFIYDVSHDGTAKFLSTSASVDTELPNMALRQAVRNFSLNAVRVQGRGAGLTTLTGIVFFVRRWTTAGTGGTAATPAPRRIGTTASTTAATSVDGAITAGTVSGAVQAMFGCGAAGPGGFVARDDDSKVLVEGTSADELNINSVQGGSSALKFSMDAEIEE